MLISLKLRDPQRLLWRQWLHARRNGNRTHLPSGVDKDRRTTFNRCYSLTPTASFSSRITSWAHGALIRSCSISVVRTDRDSFGSCIAIRHTSTSFRTQSYTSSSCYHSSNRSLFRSCDTLSNTSSSSSGSCNLLAMIVFRFFPSTPYVFRLRDDCIGKNVADIRLSRPPFSGAT